MPDTSPKGGLSYRVAELQKTVERLEEKCDDQAARLEKKVDHQGEQLVRLESLPGRVANLSKAAWWLAGIIVTASIGFGFGVLALIPS